MTDEDLAKLGLPWGSEADPFRDWDAARFRALEAEERARGHREHNALAFTAAAYWRQRARHLEAAAREDLSR